jgi:hypothetical protein
MEKWKWVHLAAKVASSTHEHAGLRYNTRRMLVSSTSPSAPAQKLATTRAFSLPYDRYFDDGRVIGNTSRICVASSAQNI